MKLKIYFVQGVEGPHISIGDMRVCGPKAWGGGLIVHQWEVPLTDIVNALNNIFNPAHRSLKTLEDETDQLLSYIKSTPTKDADKGALCDCPVQGFTVSHKQGCINYE